MVNSRWQLMVTYIWWQATEKKKIKDRKLKNEQHETHTLWTTHEDQHYMGAFYSIMSEDLRSRHRWNQNDSIIWSTTSVENQSCKMEYFKWFKTILKSMRAFGQTASDELRSQDILKLSIGPITIVNSTYSIGWLRK